MYHQSTTGRAANVVHTNDWLEAAHTIAMKEAPVPKMEYGWHHQGFSSQTLFEDAVSLTRSGTEKLEDGPSCSWP